MVKSGREKSKKARVSSRSAAIWKSPWLSFVAAVAVRLAFFAMFDQPPVQFDARQYVSAALAAPVDESHRQGVEVMTMDDVGSQSAEQTEG